MNLWNSNPDPYGKWLEASDLQVTSPINPENIATREFYRNLTEDDKRFLAMLKIKWSVE